MVEDGENQRKISQKRMKSEEFVEEGGEDRISELQDCLLVEILSRLPSTKYAIRTGTLSKRWKHLWTCVDSLSFTSVDYDPYPQSPLNPNSMHNFFSSLSPNSMPNFFSLVDKTLTQCRQLNLKKFEVYSGCYDIRRFESQVNNWIQFAITRDVEELKLVFRNMKNIFQVPLNQFIFTGSCIRDLTLEGCNLNPSGAISWKNLTSLSITYGKLTEDMIENISSGSPQLETLELSHCYGYRRLGVTSKSVKKLVFSGYLTLAWFLNKDIIIEINAPNIISLTIRSGLWLRNLLLLNVSSVVEANLDYRKYEPMDEEDEEEMLKGFILKLCHVKELKIGGLCSEVVSRLEAKGFVFPSNVTFENFEFVNWSGSDCDSVESKDL